jgi:hypothetical protein
MLVPGARDGGMDGGMDRGMDGGMTQGPPNRPYPTGTGGTVAVPFEGSLDLETGTYQRLVVQAFPPRAWAPQHRAQLLLAEFASRTWFDETVGRPPTEPLQEEIRQLLADVYLRNARLPEIVAQSDDFSPYWANMLMVTPGSRPATWLMITTMMLVGTLVAMKYKNLHMHPRPVQVYPALMPVILTPGHPSFPSGHALQCELIADCVARANPALEQPARALAERIARNREIAGVHFPRDRIASRRIAEHLRSVLHDEKTGVMNELVDEIVREYAGVTSAGPLNGQDPVPWPT